MWPVPYWRSDANYYPKGDSRRESHRREIEAQERINQRIVASSADGSYSITVRPEDKL